jgi:hypothetical protein
MSVEMNETFTVALRRLLVEQVEHGSTGRSWSRRSRRWSITAGAAVALLAGGGGIAAATGAFSSGVPGSQAVSYLAAPVSIAGNGTETVQLGKAPVGANAIAIEFSCLTPGTFNFADGSGVSCSSQADVSNSLTYPDTYTLSLSPGQDSTTITADPGQRWRLTATYVTATTTPWKVNASGQTYGSQNQNGTPDLVAVIATNRSEGYVYANQLEGPQPTTPSQAVAEGHQEPGTLTVYESDGKTPIGQFVVGK